MATQNTAAVKGGRGVKSDRTSWVQVYPNGGRALILIFGNAAVREFGLKSGDRVSLDFDAEGRRVKLRRIDTEAKLKGLDKRTKEYREALDKLSEHPMLSAHGGVETRLKLPFTDFAREHFPDLELPYKTRVSRDGRALIFDVPGKRRGKRTKPVVPVTPKS